MSLRMQDLVLPVLAAGAVAAVIRTRRGQTAKTPRGRLRDLAWCAALLLISVCVMSTAYLIFVRNDMQAWALLFPLVAAIVLIARPRLAARIVPVALILYGLAGFVVARDYSSWGGVNTYGLTMVTNPYFEADLVLPQAYALLLAGGWLTWRSADPLLARSRLLLRRVAALDPRGQLRALLLLPVVAITAGLIEPNLWLGSGPGIIWTVVIASGAVAVLRRWPELAGRAAAVGVVCLGLAGLSLAATWAGGSGGFPVTVYGWVMDGAVLVRTQHAADAAAVQGLALLAFGAWLVPQAFPEIRRFLGGSAEVELARRVERLTESRAVAVDTASADLRRLERDLHDGAQARLVALGMSLRAAERLILTSPDAAIALVAEARETSARALTELRELVRGVLPPVLADRGLADAVRALALDSPLAVETDVDLPGRLPAPVETACYFAVAEVLTNAVKHSSARDARIEMSHAAGILRIEVTDFGLGGADPSAGSGLAGVERRLATFDGILAISSPGGGPTIVVMEVPCALSSPKISSS
jgi:signal transduction histidine kinase